MTSPKSIESFFPIISYKKKTYLTNTSGSFYNVVSFEITKEKITTFDFDGIAFLSFPCNFQLYVYIDAFARNRKYDFPRVSNRCNFLPKTNRDRKDRSNPFGRILSGYYLEINRVHIGIHVILTILK